MLFTPKRGVETTCPRRHLTRGTPRSPAPPWQRGRCRAGPGTPRLSGAPALQEATSGHGPSGTLPSSCTFPSSCTLLEQLSPCQTALLMLQVPLSRRCPQLTCPPAYPAGSSGSNPTCVPPPGSSAPEHRGPRSLPRPAPGLWASTRPLLPGVPNPAPCSPWGSGPESSEARGSRTKGAGRDHRHGRKLLSGAAQHAPRPHKEKLQPCSQRRRNGALQIAAGARGPQSCFGKDERCVFKGGSQGPRRAVGFYLFFR